MEKQNTIHFAIIGVLTFAVLFMSVGFATVSQSLDIVGSSTKNAKEFYIALNEDSYQEGDGSVDLSSKAISDDRIDLTMHFNQPGDYYLASIDIQNFGDLDGVLDEIRMSEHGEQNTDNIAYSIIYDNDEVFTGSATDMNLAINNEVGSNVKNIVIKIMYDPAEGAEIPDGGIDVSAFAEFDFIQSL